MIALNRKQILLTLCFLVGISLLLYLFYNIETTSFAFAMKIRFPKMLVIATSAFCIGAASIIFQTLIHNTIVTPCLLGMNGLYILIHTAVVFVLGSTSILVTNKALSFAIDLAIMAISSLLIYGFLFKKTKGNVLYILLAGTVMATLFTSITSTLQRMMDPNEFATLQNALIAGFHKVNSDILFWAILCIVAIFFWIRKAYKVLDVVAMGKEQAINLGVAYDQVTRKLLIAVTFLIAIATAMVGPISFLGLIIANLARQLFKTYRHFYLILGATCIGMITLYVGQLCIEHIFEFNANISAFINISGGIYFLYLLLRQRRSYGNS